MITIGITGGIGSGKTTVTKIFSLMNIPVYIADVESKKLVATSLIIQKKLIAQFGEELYINGELDKPKLASLIFGNKEYLRKVNEIIHPEVEQHFKQWTKKMADHPIVVKEAAILFESGFNKFVDKTITVYTPQNVRIERTMKRDNLSREDVINRISNQMADEEKAKLSDFVIVNDGTCSLISQVVTILNQLNTLRQG